ncbi:MAG TPA: type II secretion system protein [Syntrophales bacterium]|nr:type II secretion system protein [Syntrophales bacterium]
MNRKNSSPCGFTLLEILVALVILGTSVVIVLQLFSSGLRSIRVSEDLALASLAAEAKLQEILEDPAMDEKTTTDVTESGYRFDVAVTEALKERTENLTIKMLQVDLTVRWMTGAKERSLTLRTQKVVDRLRTAMPEKPS